MMEKVKISRNQADAIEMIKEKAKGMLVVDLLEALKNGYEVEEEYKVGDWVAPRGDERELPHGEIATQIVNISNDRYIYWGKNGGCFNRDKDRFRHATPEEIKAEQERRMWKSIGREVGEFKVNDVFIDKKGMPFIFASVTHLASGIISLKTAYEWHRIGNFKGLYPAESFVELGGENDE